MREANSFLWERETGKTELYRTPAFAYAYLLGKAKSAG